MIDFQFHPFDIKINPANLPEKFTYPFNYTPHPHCVSAAENLKHYLQGETSWADELSLGKMFGVLVVQNKEKEIGYLAAFSGNLAGENYHPYFVPPVFDMLQKGGFFQLEVEAISSINNKIKELTENKEYILSKKSFEEQTALANKDLLEQKKELKNRKNYRDLYRTYNTNCTEMDLERLNKESQQEKGKYKRLEKIWEARLALIQEKQNKYTQEIDLLKAERKMRSAQLQQKLFDSFQFLNQQGESKGLNTIFEKTIQKIPPAGAGECAAPKLLQHAFLKGYKPISMAEFWWGASPKKEIRQHGNFYPSCKGRCEPILGHMLQGINIEQDPLANKFAPENELDIVYEDEFILLINKPSGLLSAPGKSSVDSVYHRVQSKYPEASGTLVVHRLDMATSGLLLIAKNKEVHKNLQAQFKNRSIKKRYIALLNGKIEGNSGTITLGILPDYNNRPCQMVDNENGKLALTHWRVLEISNNITRIEFTPVTGRTHQLRIHAAHFLGLNAPILGDELYGKKDERLYLHAESIEFIHPISGKTVCIEKKANF